MKKIICILPVLFTLIILSCENNDDTIVPKQPTITQITPELVQAGSEITITGTDLNDNPIFIFNGEALETSNISSDNITLNIPENVSSGMLEIAFNQSQYNIEAYLKIADENWSATEALSYFQLEFVSNTVGFAMSRHNDTHKMDKTTDGGNTWSSILQVPVPSSSFEAVSANVVYTRTISNMIKKTVDGGNTWQDVNSLDIDFLIEELSFKNELEGILLANKLGKSYVFKTTDGGNSWNEVLEIDTPIHKVEVAYHNESTIHLLNRENNELIKSEDNGINWLTSDFNIATAGNPITYNFIDEDNAWASVDPLIDTSGGLFMTNDGGMTWENINIPELSSERIVSVNLFNELKAHILTDQGGNLYSSDGGETWKLLYLEEPGDITTAATFGSTLYMVKGSQLLKKEIDN